MEWLYLGNRLPLPSQFSYKTSNIVLQPIIIEIVQVKWKRNPHFD